MPNRNRMEKILKWTFMKRFLIRFTFWQHHKLHSVGHGGQSWMGNISWLEVELKQIITIITIFTMITIIKLITIITIIMIPFNQIRTYIRYYFQQLFCLFLGCCIVCKKRKHLTFWSRDLFSLMLQAFPFNKSTEWWERGWSKISSRHVISVQLSDCFEGVRSTNVLDHLWNSDGAYLRNSTLSAYGCIMNRFFYWINMLVGIHVVIDILVVW